MPIIDIHRFLRFSAAVAIIVSTTFSSTSPADAQSSPDALANPAAPQDVATAPLGGVLLAAPATPSDPGATLAGARRSRRFGAALISVGISAFVPGSLGVVLWAWMQDHASMEWLGGSIALLSTGAVLVGLGAWLRFRGNGQLREVLGGLSLGVDEHGASLGWKGAF
jgi:hypothetical protein